MNRFVANQFEMILRRDYGFDPKVKETPEGLKFTITVNDPRLRTFMTGMAYPKAIGIEEKIDRETGKKYRAPIIKDVRFIHSTDVANPNCNTLTFCLDAEGDDGAVKMNIFEHTLRLVMASKSNSNIAI